ncbi:GNAT family N-acetyltransferase [Roseateles sp. DAIF2]|uniref:GNAT family N-acetyltransferase n=1 Tax=Roseateles sp. DAIF2 TaxID=2714952 RepID=UPI0018A27D36|nr:GNAT family N-acetyltransferase [Roseateles sp. DAIF2]QPF72835.1 GNAT family N-acetyltransferase [Roseateles sp. DAIF2]
MDRTSTPRYTRHDEAPPADAQRIDAELDAYNAAAAPLHEVRAMSVFARDAEGRVLGGALGRSWGPCCELQQLWVEPAQRRRGIGAALVREFEALARERGCRIAYLETFSFQAPALYRELGYRSVHEHAVYPHGIVKHLMLHEL